MSEDQWHQSLSERAPSERAPSEKAPSEKALSEKALSHVKGEDVSGDTTQTSGMSRREAISGKSVGSEKLWMGQTHVAAGVKSADHHHGESETAIYVVSGTPSFVFAQGDQEVRLDAKPGDYIFVPPYVPHREENAGAGEAVVVIARSTQEAIVVNLPSLWPAEAGE
jgi:uncharacterized RmlC-like cupin family protein